MRETVKATVSDGESEGTKNNCEGEKHTDSKRETVRGTNSLRKSAGKKL